MEQISRRSALQIGVAVVTLGFTGCADDPTQGDEPSLSDEPTPDTEPVPETESSPSDEQSPTPETSVDVTTPEFGDCEVVPRLHPTPNDAGVGPREYPSYPDELTADSAVTFAREYERSDRHNEILAGGTGGTDTIIVNAGVPSDLLIERRNGFLIGVTVTVDTEDNRTPEGGTAVPAYSDEFARWYLLTERVGFQGPDLEGKTLPESPPESVDLSEARVIYCD